MHIKHIESFFHEGKEGLESRPFPDIVMKVPHYLIEPEC